MRKILTLLLSLMTPMLHASMAIVVGLRYVEEDQTLDVVALVQKTSEQNLALKWGPCQETYPMKCFAELKLASSDDRCQPTETDYAWETLTVSVANLSKPTYVVVKGDQGSQKEIFIKEN